MGQRTVLLVAVTALLLACAASASARRSTSHSSKLAQATAKYNRFQGECARGNIAVMSQILHWAAQIKRSGGHKIPARQLYQCLRFDVHFQSTIQINDDTTFDALDYQHIHWTWVLASPKKIVLKADDEASDSHQVVIDDGGVTERSSEFEGGQESFTYDNGDGTSCTSTIAGEGVDQMSSVSPSLSLNPSADATHQRSTAQFLVDAFAGNEKYQQTECEGSSTNFLGTAWEDIFITDHKGQSVDDPCTNGYTFNFTKVLNGGSLRKLTISNSIAHVFPAGGGTACHENPIGVGNPIAGSEQSPVTSHEQTDVTITLDPPAWRNIR